MIFYDFLRLALMVAVRYSKKTFKKLLEPVLCDMALCDASIHFVALPCMDMLALRYCCTLGNDIGNYIVFQVYKELFEGVHIRPAR